MIVIPVETAVQLLDIIDEVRPIPRPLVWNGTDRGCPCGCQMRQLNKLPVVTEQKSRLPPLSIGVPSGK
jgi:hypothetical protein